MKRTLILGATLALALTLAGTAAAASFSERGTAAPATTNQACQAGSTCMSLKGGIHGAPISGAVEVSFNADWSQGGRCAPARGTLILSNSHGDSLNLMSTGTLCRHGARAAIYSGSWNIMNGSGKFASNGIGNGKLTMRQLGNGLVQLAVRGSFSMNSRPAQ